jgi:hypothetical protein
MILFCWIFTNETVPSTGPNQYKNREESAPKNMEAKYGEGMGHGNTPVIALGTHIVVRVVTVTKARNRVKVKGGMATYSQVRAPVPRLTGGPCTIFCP